MTRRARPRVAARVGLVCLVASVAGCATGQTVAGTGDISFRLQWEGPADLDLFVRDPSGFQISYHEKRSPSGGVLDVDCNATPQSMCAHPLENVFWPTGRAPGGTYEYDVYLTNTHQQPVPIWFTVDVLHGRHIAATVQGALSRFGTHWGARQAIWKR